MGIRTFEIISKYIGKETKIKVRLEPNVTPHANPETKEIVLPSNIREDRVFTALAECVHEACHVRYTTFPTKEIVDDAYEHHILNAIEDIRIDKKAFHILPNIRGWYDDLWKEIKEKQPGEEDRKKMPMESRVLCEIIAQQEGFNHYSAGDKEVMEFIQDYGTDAKVYQAQACLDRNDLKGARKIVKDIANDFDEDRKKKRRRLKKNEGDGAAGRPDPNAVAQALKDLGKDPAKAWGQLDATANTAYSELGPAALKEQTQRQFEELLKINETKLFTTEEGGLNTQNLCAFLTEDVEDLFAEERYVHPKKSKITVVLDASGSMSSQLMDKQTNRAVVIKTTKSIKEVIDKVNESEGLCVDYEIAAFEDTYHKLNQDNWEKEYNAFGGGTNILNAFKTAAEDMAKDLDILGNKMIIFLTDGEVSQQEIDQVQKEIIKTGSDIRVMIMGVGANPQGAFCSKIVKDLNILDEESADLVLMDAIMAVLDG